MDVAAMAADLEAGVTGRFPYPLPVRTHQEASLALELLSELAAKTNRDVSAAEICQVYCVRSVPRGEGLR